MPHKTATLLKIARKIIGLGSLSSEEQALWDALDRHAQFDLKREARENAERSYSRAVRRHVRVHGEPARRHYATMSSQAREALGVGHVLRAPAPVLPSQSRPRARGAGRPAVRGSSRRSSARSGESGDENGESSEPPPAGRLCECGCGRDISHLRRDARYLNGTHRLRGLRARERERGSDEPPIDGLPQPGKYTVHSTAEYEALRERIEGGCRCNGHHIAAGREDQPGPRCVKCGHRRGQLTESAA